MRWTSCMSKQEPLGAGLSCSEEFQHNSILLPTVVSCKVPIGDRKQPPKFLGALFQQHIHLTTGFYVHICQQSKHMQKQCWQNIEQLLYSKNPLTGDPASEPSSELQPANTKCNSLTASPKPKPTSAPFHLPTELSAQIE